MDHPDLTASNFMGNTIGTKRVKHYESWCLNFNVKSVIYFFLISTRNHFVITLIESVSSGGTFNEHFNKCFLGKCELNAK